MTAKNTKPGFTLVELNLSVMFVAILILGVAFTTIQVTRMYQQGVTVKTVNQVGRDVFEQMRRDFASASPSAVNIEAAGNGRICLGNVSYLYNDALALNSDSDTIKDASGNNVTLARVEDKSGKYCQKVDGAYTSVNVQPGDEVTELLESDAIPLAIHKLNATTHLEESNLGTRQSIYSLSVVLGTNELDTVDGEAAICKPPTDNQANFESCFVSEFETIVRAGEVGV